MLRIEDVCRYLEAIAPHQLAASWDNVGLLVGRSDRFVRRVLTCLTVTPAVVAEAIDERAELVICHHPLPFRPLTRLTADNPTGSRLLDLIEAHIAVYSPHTSWDSAADGINAALARLLELEQVRPMQHAAGETQEQLGSGRWGVLPVPQTPEQLAERLLQGLHLDACQLAGNFSHPVQRIAIACGAGDDFVPLAIQLGCQVMVTGELRFHAAMEAEMWGMSIVALGHYASERIGVEQLANRLSQTFPDLQVWASQRERDVWQFVHKRSATPP